MCLSIPIVATLERDFISSRTKLVVSWTCLLCSALISRSCICLLVSLRRNRYNAVLLLRRFMVFQATHLLAYSQLLRGLYALISCLAFSDRLQAQRVAFFSGSYTRIRVSFTSKSRHCLCDVRLLLLIIKGCQLFEKNSVFACSRVLWKERISYAPIFIAFKVSSIRFFASCDRDAEGRLRPMQWAVAGALEPFLL